MRVAAAWLLCDKTCNTGGDESVSSDITGQCSAAAGTKKGGGNVCFSTSFLFCLLLHLTLLSCCPHPPVLGVTSFV